MTSPVRFVLGSGLRIRLLSSLAKRPQTPTELAVIERKHVSHVSRALSELRHKGLVEYEYISARERLYRPTDRGLAMYTLIMRLSR